MSNSKDASFQDIMRFWGVKPINEKYSEWRSCQIKYRHGTKEQAERESVRLNIRNKGHKIVHAYHCQECEGWHCGELKDAEA